MVAADMVRSGGLRSRAAARPDCTGSVVGTRSVQCPEYGPFTPRVRGALTSALRRGAWFRGSARLGVGRKTLGLARFLLQALLFLLLLLGQLALALVEPVIRLRHGSTCPSRCRAARTRPAPA